ncbi:MAG: alpha-ketoglutarate-dependent dioxygenase AlkB [Myxococcota bacterium]
MNQTLLFGRERVSVDGTFATLRRVELGHGAWLEHQTGWLRGHLQVFEALRDSLRWRAQRRQMYEREIEVPRLLSDWPNPGEGHPIVSECAEYLTKRYDCNLSSISLAYYRDGRDSVAPHGDRMGSLTDHCVIAIVAVGDRRRFQIRALETDSPAHSFELGWGDLLVMGGTCQRTHVHAIPKANNPVGPRISIQFRPWDPFARTPLDMPRGPLRAGPGRRS